MNEKLIKAFDNYIDQPSEPSRLATTVLIKLIQLMSDNDSLKWVLTEFYTKYNENREQRDNLLNHYIDAFENKLIDIYNIIDEIGDDPYTIKVMLKLGLTQPFNDELKKIIIAKHLITMAKTGYYIPQVIKSDFMNKDKIEWLLNSIERKELGYTVDISHLLKNHQISPIQLDRLATLLKKDKSISIDAPMWFVMVLNPNINSVIIKKHLSRDSLRELLQVQSPKCMKVMVDQNQNKPAIDKLALIEAFPFLMEYGLNSSSLDISIESLEIQ